MLIEEPLFDTLRTKQQLGYHVDCSLRDTNGVLGYTITVHTQASKFSPDVVNDKVEDFLKKMQKYFSKLTDKNLNKYKKDLIKVKRVEDVELGDEVERNWGEIINQDYLFDRNENEIIAVEKIKIADLRKWWEAHNIFGGKTKARKISFQVGFYFC